MSAHRFKARLEAGGHQDAWVFIHIPAGVTAAFGSKGRVSVIADLNGETYHTSLFPNGDGTHHMLVNKAMQSAANARAGDEVDVVLRPDDGTAGVELPGDLAQALEGDATAGGLFEKLSPSCKREYVAWIVEAKRPETRADRVAKTVDMVAAGRKRPSS